MNLLATTPATEVDSSTLRSAGHGPSFHSVQRPRNTRHGSLLFLLRRAQILLFSGRGIPVAHPGTGAPAGTGAPPPSARRGRSGPPADPRRTRPGVTPRRGRPAWAPGRSGATPRRRIGTPRPSAPGAPMWVPRPTLVAPRLASRHSGGGQRGILAGAAQRLGHESGRQQLAHEVTEEPHGLRTPLPRRAHGLPDRHERGLKKA